MFPNKPNSFRGLFANNNALRLSQHHTKQSTDSRRSRTNDKHRVFFGNLRNASSPKSCSKDISYKQSLLITHGIGNEIQALISIRYANILRLPPSIRHPKAHPPLESAQLFTYPCRQKKHSPQKVSTLTVTRSPGLTNLTSRPVCSTIPTISCPTVIPGTARGTPPCLICKSLVQILPRVTRTIASRESLNSGFGFSINSNFPCLI